MQKNQDIRWKQRFSNFKKSYNQMTMLIEKPTLTEIEMIALTKIFEITFELSWKLLKDYMNSEGFTLRSPRETLKTAFQEEYIDSGDSWLKALQTRNLTVHTYDKDILEEITNFCKSEFHTLVTELHNDFRKRI